MMKSGLPSPSRSAIASMVESAELADSTVDVAVSIV
jgi:hypothetical protein